MKIKKLLVSLFLTALFLFQSHATGAGILLSLQPEINFNQNNTASCYVAGKISGSMNLERIRFIPAIGLEFKAGDNLFYGFFATADYVFFNTQLHNVWSFYSCAGLSVDLCYDFKSSVSFGGGLRAVAGVSITFMDGYMELYSQAALSPFVNFYSNSINSPEICLKLPVETGIRIYF